MSSEESIIEYKKRLVELAGPIGTKTPAELSKEDAEEVVMVLERLEKVNISVPLLEKTKIGFMINKLRKSSEPSVALKAKSILKRWKTMVKKPAVVERVKSEGPHFSAPKLQVPISFTEDVFKIDDEMRLIVREKFATFLGDSFDSEMQKRYCAYRMEESMFDHFKSVSKEYKAQFRSILFNLKDESNLEFNAKLCHQMIPFEAVPVLTSVEMASSERLEMIGKIKSDAQESARSDWDKEHMMGGTTDMWRCGKCGERKCTYYQMQTRGADEPMTNFVTCTVCENRWKC